VKLVHASILLLALAGSSRALSQPEGQPDWIADAKQVAAQEGISVGEAVRRFQLSEKAGRLQDRFQREDADTFAGMEIVSRGATYRKARGTKPCVPDSARPEPRPALPH
jgi:hypothetical protein